MVQEQSENPTKQRRPSFGKGGVPTPPGFEAHPERRHNGAWKKEDTARYKLEQMLKLSESELGNLAQYKDAPLFERKLATCIATGKWKEIEGMMNQVYGQPKVIQENHNIEYKPLIDLTKRKKNGED
jgi:hypothetical protein